MITGLTKLFHKLKCIFEQRMIHLFEKLFYFIMQNEQSLQSNKEEAYYWKSKIFNAVAPMILMFCSPLVLFRCYLFFHQNQPVTAIVLFIMYFVALFIIQNKHISLSRRKYFVIIILYSLSLFLLITLGQQGSGMISMFFILLLAGCFLRKRQIIQMVTVNIFVFLVLSVLLYLGVFDGTVMEAYKKLWIMNTIAFHVYVILLLILMNMIINGLEKQAQMIKESEEILVDSEQKHKVMIANISDAIVIVDQEGIVTYHSTNLVQRFPWMSKNMINKNLIDEIHPEDRKYIESIFLALLKKNGEKITAEARYLREDGKVGYLEMTAANLLEDKKVRGILINYSDITERKLREEEIVYLYQHDALTGIFNRDFFEKEVKRLDNKKYLPLSYIVGDINGLKMINDSLGHAEGDKLLIKTVKLLQSCCGDKDILSRTAGDEFTIVLPNTDSEAAFERIKKIYLVFEEYNRNIQGELYHISISLGYSTKTALSENFMNVIKIAEDFMCKRKLLEGRSFHSSILTSMKTALFEKSYETEQHAQRLVKLSRAVGEAVGLTSQQFDELELFSSLHDIGKIGIDNEILNKPGKLTDDEWVLMKKHSDIGYRIAMSSPELVTIAYYILTHHERWDGKGYPQGLAGENIPLLSRILAVVDAYDAMIADRPYRKGMEKKEAMQEIINNRGTQFDPGIAKVFIEIISKDDKKQPLAGAI